jgi:alpha-1,6-mannosyltransferase
MIVPGEKDETRALTLPGCKTPVLRDLMASGGHANSSRLQTLASPALPYDASYRQFVDPRKLRRAALSHAPDVIELHSPYVVALALRSLPALEPRTPGSAAPRPRIVHTMTWHSDFIDTYGRVLRHAIKQRIGETWARRAAKFSPAELGWRYVRRITTHLHAVFASSRTQAEKLRQHGIERVVHVPFGVDKETFHESGRIAQGTRFVAVGRLAIEKHVDVLLDAFARIRNARPQATLSVIGDGPERARLMARGDQGVTWVGFERDRTALAALFRQHQVLLHACPYETFGLGVAEALATGIAAVLPDQGGASEWPESTSLRHYPSLNAEAMAAQALNLLELPAEERHEAGLQSARNIASERDHFHAIVDHYRALRR